MAQTLGVPTLSYAPFVFFNLINPLVAALFGMIRIGIAPLPETVEVTAKQNSPRAPLS